MGVEMTDTTSYQAEFETEWDNRDIAIAMASQALDRVHDSLDRRKFDTSVMDVHTYGDAHIAVRFDVMYQHGDPEYADAIRRKLELCPDVSDVQEVYYEAV